MDMTMYDNKEMLYSIIATKTEAIVNYTINGKTMETKVCKLEEVSECIEYITKNVLPKLLKK